MSIKAKLAQLVEQYGSRSNIPLTEFNSLLGLGPDEPVSKDRMRELFIDKSLEESAFLNPTESKSYNEDGSMYDTGQTHQRFREVIRKRILDNVFNTGRGSKERG